VPKLNATGGAEIAKLIVCPPAGIGHSGRAVACWRGKGRVAFRHGTFEQLPTLFHVVNALADFEILEVTEAGMVETVGRATRFAGPDPIDR
jgi:hypothetical protein